MNGTFDIYENFEKALAETGEYVVQVRGESMYPMLRYRRDPVLIHPVEGELKRYDVAVYNRGDSYVIHRILEARPDCYVFRGDNCTGKEIVPRHLVLGKVVGFWRVPRSGRSGRFVSVTDRSFIIYSRLWVALNPLNVILVRNLRRLGTLCRKIFY